MTNTKPTATVMKRALKLQEMGQSYRATIAMPRADSEMARGVDFSSQWCLRLWNAKKPLVTLPEALAGNLN